MAIAYAGITLRFSTIAADLALAAGLASTSSKCQLLPFTCDRNSSKKFSNDPKLIATVREGWSIRRFHSPPLRRRTAFIIHESNLLGLREYNGGH